MSPELQDAETLAAELAPPTVSEVALEIEINDACHDLALAITDEQQRAAFARVQELHERRTPAQIARLEYERVRQS